MIAPYLKLFGVLESAPTGGHYAHPTIWFAIPIVSAVQPFCLDEVDAVVNALCLELHKMNLACTTGTHS